MIFKILTVLLPKRMMLRLKLTDVFNEVQKSASCHQKYLQVVQNLFTSVPFEEFFIEFKRILNILFQQMLGQNVENVNRSLTFCAKFCSNLAKPLASPCGENDDDNYRTHSFVSDLIKEMLKYHDLADERGRFYSCQFISVLLKEVDNDANLESSLYESIQDAMLARIIDIKPLVRLQAVSALLRLQDPTDPNCPVIRAFIQGFGDPSVGVRRAIVQNIAPCKATLSHVIERLRDVDHTVRSAAFCKCAVIGPKALKISDRQVVVLNGINEDNKSVKKVFIEILLPKWLAAYDNDYIKIMNALRLDADENDIKQTVFIYEKFLDILFKSEPLKDLVKGLSLNNEKLVPQDKISVESIFYWSYLLHFFESKMERDSYVAPELSLLCGYIESLILDKSSRVLGDWEYLEYQQILLKMFEMAERADLTDEVGRQLLHRLIIKTMNKTKLEDYVLIQLVLILQKLLPDTETLSNEICMIISEITEPTDELGPDELRNMNFQKAEIRVKLNVLRHEMDEAVKNNDFMTAAKLQEEVELLKVKEKEFCEQFEAASKVTTTQDSPEIISRALNVLIALMQILQVQKIPVSLRSCMNEFLTPLIINANVNVHWRVFKCIVLFSLLSKDVALENLKFISSPIIIYRLTSTYDKPTLLVSVCAISDLLRVYGRTLFKRDSVVDMVDNAGTIKNSNSRRLYKLSLSADIKSFDFDNITCEDLIDIILDMLDDDVQEIRENAANAISKLVYMGLMVSSSLLSRLLLKWFNPLTEKYDQKIQQVLGASIIRFSREVKGSAEILEKTIIPTLRSIGNAPNTSPLYEVDVNNVLRFLAAITKIERSEYTEIHQNLAHSILSKIQLKSYEKCVPLLANMLLCFDEPHDNQVVIDELVKQTENCLKVVNDRVAVKTLIKYRKKLTGQGNDVGNTTIANGTCYSSLLDSTIQTPVKNTKIDENHSGIIERRETNLFSKSSVKRRKPLKAVPEAISLDTVTVGCIEAENNFELDDVHIETPTTTESYSSEESPSFFKPQTSEVIAETSSNSGESGRILRRSKRKITKRN